MTGSAPSNQISTQPPQGSVQPSNNPTPKKEEAKGWTIRVRDFFNDLYFQLIAKPVEGSTGSQSENHQVKPLGETPKVDKPADDQGDAQ